MQRYLVVGMAKTGTTVISKTIQNTLGIKNYFLEPKRISFFERFGADQDSDGVVKILFDHWMQRPRLLNAIMHDELSCRFKNQVILTRDPRAGFVSRLHYIAYAHFLSPDTTAEDRNDWIEIFRAKEYDPEIPLSVMVRALDERFGCKVQPAGAMIERYADFISRIEPKRRILLKYEDFVEGTMKGHPMEKVLSGNRDVGPDLQRTRRSAGNDDWMSFVTDADVSWMEAAFAPLCKILGYDPAIPDRATRRQLSAPIRPENSSEYVTRLIQEATDIATIRNG